MIVTSIGDIIYLFGGYLSEKRSSFPYKKAWDFLINAYGVRCVYCHKNISTQIDHVIPYSYIPYHGIENLRPCCAICNLIASDKVFKDFAAKYDFIRGELNKKTRQSMLLCNSCLIPYYSALHRSFIFCPRCYALEYELPNPKTNAWRDWLFTLHNAGINYRANFHLASIVFSSDCNIPMKGKIDLLVEYNNTHNHLVIDDFN